MEDRNVTQRQIADYLKVTEQAISNKFRGRSRFTIDQMAALADFFGVSVDYLLGRSPLATAVAA